MLLVQVSLFSIIIAIVLVILLFAFNPVLGLMLIAALVFGYLAMREKRRAGGPGK